MLEAFIQSFKLRIAYRVNGILYNLKRVPLIKKLLPEQLYDSPHIKAFARVLAVLGEIFGFFAGKLLYIALCILLPCYYLKPLHGIGYAPLFLNIFFFLTVLGALSNNRFCQSDASSSYAVFLMRMDAKRYALSNYAYYIVKTFVGFAVSLASLYFIAKANGFADIHPVWIVLMPLLAVCVKVIAAAADIKLFERKRKLVRSFSAVALISIPLFFALAFALPALGIVLPTWGFYIATAVFTLLAIPAAVCIIHSSEYRRIYQKNRYSPISTSDIQRGVQEKYKQKLELGAEKESRKTGCALFNALFVRRHRKLLMRPAQRMAIIIALAVAAAVVISLFDRELAGTINSRLMNTLPHLLLLMYFINRGATTTQIFFYSCDCNMLTYRFYRQPKTVLELFKERLKTVVLINLLPGAVICLGAALLLFVTGGTERVMDYPVLIASILFMSVFFSVHYLVLYYLFQPYTAGLETKHPVYWLISGLTYPVCYLIATKLGKLISPMVFGCSLIGFCVLYTAIALILAYKLAPKTFKLR